MNSFLKKEIELVPLRKSWNFNQLNQIQKVEDELFYLCELYQQLKDNKDSRLPYDDIDIDIAIKKTMTKMRESTIVFNEYLRE